MNLLNLILPTHARIVGGAVSSGTASAAKPETLDAIPQTPHLQRFEPWLLGLRNMIEEGDWHSAQVFADQIHTRLRHLELESRCDAAGVVKH